MNARPHKGNATLLSIAVLVIMLLAFLLLFSSISSARQANRENSLPPSPQNGTITNLDKTDTPAFERCKALQKDDFSAVQDAPTQLTSARVIETKESPIYCQVQGYVSPQVGFELRLPIQNWN